MFALPPAMTGALLALFITGYTINIMSVIGVILLFGLVTKNSILLVDLTIQKQETGLNREEALRLACPIRLRPILMTAISMIFGVLPVALAIGEGADGGGDHGRHDHVHLSHPFPGAGGLLLYGPGRREIARQARKTRQDRGGCSGVVAATIH
jgi:hypothetical protein